MAYAYVGIVVPSHQPVRAWCERALTHHPPDVAGFDEHELGGWFVRSDMLDEQVAGRTVLERLDASSASLQRDPLLRLYALIDDAMEITHRARLGPSSWRVLQSNRAWVSHLRAQLQPDSTLAFAIVHVTPQHEEAPDVLAHQSRR